MGNVDSKKNLWRGLIPGPEYLNIPLPNWHEDFLFIDIRGFKKYCCCFHKEIALGQYHLTKFRYFFQQFVQNWTFARPPNLCSVWSVGLVNRNPPKGETETSQLPNNWKGQAVSSKVSDKQVERLTWQGGRVKCQTNNWTEIVLPKVVSLGFTSKTLHLPNRLLYKL